MRRTGDTCGGNIRFPPVPARAMALRPRSVHKTPPRRTLSPSFRNFSQSAVNLSTATSCSKTRKPKLSFRLVHPARIVLTTFLVSRTIISPVRTCYGPESMASSFPALSETQGTSIQSMTGVQSRGVMGSPRFPPEHLFSPGERNQVNNGGSQETQYTPRLCLRLYRYRT